MVGFCRLRAILRPENEEKSGKPPCLDSSRSSGSDSLNWNFEREPGIYLEFRKQAIPMVARQAVAARTIGVHFSPWALIRHPK
jgi:hypothetical protein